MLFLIIFFNKFLKKFKIALKNASIAYMNLFINQGSLNQAHIQSGQCQNIKPSLGGLQLVIIMHMCIGIAYIRTRLSVNSTWKLYPEPARFLFHTFVQQIIFVKKYI